MYKLLLILTILGLLCLSCRVNHKDPTVVEQEQSATVQMNSIPAYINPTDSGVVKMNLENGRGAIRTHKDKNQNIDIEFISKGYKKITAHLSSSDTLANIRFNQITLPDGTMDGPFGRDLEYPISRDGIYMLSIHESLMAGDPWAGDFTVRIQLE